MEITNQLKKIVRFDDDLMSEEELRMLIRHLVDDDNLM